ncbi:MAG TPA: hypothetical protein PK798_15040 [Flavobacteriales bacterium]|nr:hypothetical protein [Flavobacteriales bacterium]
MSLRFLVFALVLIGLVSCKKTRLEGEFSFLEGEWECYKMAYVTYSSGNCNYDTIYNGGNRKITFFKRGKILFEKDNDKVECFPFELQSDGTRTYFVYATNRKRKHVTMWISFIGSIDNSEFFTQYFPPQEVFGINCRHIYYFKRKV